MSKQSRKPLFMQDQSFRVDRRGIGLNSQPKPPAMTFNEHIVAAITNIEKSLMTMQTNNSNLRRDVANMKTKLTEAMPELDLELPTDQQGIPIDNTNVDQSDQNGEPNSTPGTRAVPALDLSGNNTNTTESTGNNGNNTGNLSPRSKKRHRYVTPNMVDVTDGPYMTPGITTVATLGDIVFTTNTTDNPFAPDTEEDILARLRTDIDSNKEKLESAAKSINDTITEQAHMHKSIKHLKSRISTCQTDLQNEFKKDLASSIEGIKSELNETIDKLTTSVNSNTNSLTSTTDTIESMKTDLNTTTETVSDLKSDVSSMSTTMKTINDTLHSNITMTNMAINDLKTNVTTLNSDVPTLSTAVSGLQTNVSNIEEDIKGINATVLDLTTGISTMSTNVTALSTQASTMSTGMSDLNTSVSELQTNVFNLSGHVTNLNSFKDSLSDMPTIRKDLYRLLETSSEHANNTNNKFKSVDTVLSDITFNLKEGADALQSMSTEIETVDKKCDDNYTSLSDSINTTNQLLSTLKTSIEAASTRIDTCNSDIKSKCSNLTSRLDNMSDLLQSTGDTLHSCTDTVRDHGESLVSIRNQSNKFKTDLFDHQTTLDRHGDSIEDILKTINTWENSTSKFRTDIEDSIQSNVTTLKSDLSSLTTNINEQKAELLKEVSSLRSDTDIKVNELLSHMSVQSTTLTNTMNTHVSTLHARISTDINNLNTDLSKSISNSYDTLTKHINTTANTLEESLTSNVKTLNTRVDTLDTRVTTTNNELKTNLTNSIDSMNTDLTNRLQTLATTVKEHIEYVPPAPNPVDVIVESDGRHDYIGIPAEDLDCYKIGIPLFMNAEGYVYNKSEHRFVSVNDMEDPFGNKPLTDIKVYKAISTSGLWKEYVGICTNIDREHNLIRYATNGTYLITGIPDTSNLGMGETLFLDPEGRIKILADNATITTKMRRMLLGTITFIINEHTVQVHK